MPDFEKDRLEASQWARQHLSNPDGFCLLDLETTGLPQDDPEIVQIGLLNGDGTVALSTLVHSIKPIPAEATAIHGITDAMVAPGVAPDLSMLVPAIGEAIHGKTVVVYNLAYDFEVILGCLLRRCKSREKIDNWLMKARWECAMKEYARWYGQYDYRRQSYRWQTLAGGDHSAIGDCRATYDILRRMAGEG